MNQYEKNVNVILVDWRNLASWTGVTMVVSCQSIFQTFPISSLMIGTTTCMIWQPETVLMLESLLACVYQDSATGDIIDPCCTIVMKYTSHIL